MQHPARQEFHQGFLDFAIDRDTAPTWVLGFTAKSLRGVYRLMLERSERRSGPPHRERQRRLPIVSAQPGFLQVRFVEADRRAAKS